MATPNDRNRRTTSAAGTSRDRNEDAITGEPGSHPVGAGLGAAAGGAAAGAAAGAAVGPVGSVVGAIVGGVVGGYAGKAVAEKIDPTAEDAYWRSEYRNREYYDEAITYDDLQPAYRHGWESRGRYHDRTWEAAEADVRRDWEGSSHGKSMTWDRVRRPARDAWDHIERALPGDADRDGR
ncbi:MAG: hypothetical protein IT424_09850 [Pirellulales bacterium]|nr:hypothetical protein [Pirellulales bacterium]